MTTKANMKGRAEQDIAREAAKAEMGDEFTEKKFRESQQFGAKDDEVTIMPVEDEMYSAPLEEIEK
jgi:hypothetical protein